MIRNIHIAAVTFLIWSGCIVLSIIMAIGGLAIMHTFIQSF